MSKYVILIRNTGDPMVNITEEERGAHMQAWGAYMGKLGANLLDGLPFEAQGTVVTKSGSTGSRHEANGQNIGGYLIVEAGSLEEAVGLTDGCPALDSDSSSLEVRPCANM